MRKITVALFSVGLLVAAGLTLVRLGHPAKVRAQNGCTNANVQGSFGYSASGFTLAPGTLIMVPLANTGRVMADGAGNASGFDTLSVNGVIVKRTFSGTYSVKDDCSGSAVYMDSLGQKISEDFVVTNGGNQIAVVVTDPGTVISFTDVRQ
jgi:hypothetical protein